jgi:putative flippase GtrA
VKIKIIPFIIFSSVGGIGVLAYYATLILLTEKTKLLYLFSAIIAYAVNTIISFPLHKYITFRGKAQKRKIYIQFIVYVGITLAYFFINWIFLGLITEIFSISYVISQGILTVVLSYLNFGATDEVFK